MEPGSLENGLSANYDVVIVGAGLAGLTLARQLLLQTDKTILLVDKKSDLPGRSQKVGESLVQLSGYYLSKVLDLEEHLFVNHYLKYNLRFQWKTADRQNQNLEDYSASFIRLGSNIATFQLDRNVLEAHLFEINRSDPRLNFTGGVRDLKVQFSETGDDHEISVGGKTVRCRWVVDASGRGAVLKRTLVLEAANPIRHGSTWCWVEGLVNVEKLTSRSLKDVRLDRRRQKQGNYPIFLSTNHFCGEGQWFWVIPLHGKTSLGLVYDRSVVSPDEVSNGRKMLDYACRAWPLFTRDLPKRKILDEGRFFDFSYDSRRTISASRWAMTGEAGRFSDPLYSPGSDLISIYNTLIVDAILTRCGEALERKCEFYELIMHVMYEAYIPSYAVSYDCLGDQEVFTLKYTWELTIYFGFYVMPFLNDLFTDGDFMRYHLLKFKALGRVNKTLQHFLSAFFNWKKSRAAAQPEPCSFDFYELCPLRESEKMFYQVGLSREEAEQALDRHLGRLKEFARYILTHVHAVVLGDRRVLTNGPFVSSLKLSDAIFDVEQMRAAYAPFAESNEIYPWTLNAFALEPFLPAERMRATACV